MPSVLFMLLRLTVGWVHVARPLSCMDPSAYPTPLGCCSLCQPLLVLGVVLAMNSRLRSRMGASETTQSLADMCNPHRMHLSPLLCQLPVWHVLPRMCSAVCATARSPTLLKVTCMKARRCCRILWMLHLLCCCAPTPVILHCVLQTLRPLLLLRPVLPTTVAVDAAPCWPVPCCSQHVQLLKAATRKAQAQPSAWQDVRCGKDPC